MTVEQSQYDLNHAEWMRGAPNGGWRAFIAIEQYHSKSGTPTMEGMKYGMIYYNAIPVWGALMGIQQYLRGINWPTNV